MNYMLNSIAVCAISSIVLTAAVARAEGREIGAVVDCSEVYGGTATSCAVVECLDRHKPFLGSWTGPFQGYVRELSTQEANVFRPYQNTVTYSKDDCLKNETTGEQFIIGRRTDVYPAFRDLPTKTSTGLMITGRKSDGAPFFKTVDQDGINSYTLAYRNVPAEMSIWELVIRGSDNSPEMRLVTIDGQDFNETDSLNRNVTVTMSVGPRDAPVWEGVVAKGYHALQSNTHGEKKNGLRPKPEAHHKERQAVGRVRFAN
jgi:hypothetical protein